MHLLKKVFNFYIFSNIHVAFASFSLTKITLLYLQNNGNTVPFFVFFATILSYNYIRLTRLKQVKSWYFKWLKSKKNDLILLSILSFLACVYLILKIRLQALFSLIPFAFSTMFYVIPPIISGKINLRNLPAFKIFIIAFSWAGITVLFPLMQYGIFNNAVLWLFFQRFLFVLALTLPFDIRDVQYDSELLKTIPIWMGVKNAKYFGCFLLVLSLAIELLYIKANHFWIYLFVIVCLGFLLLKSSTNQHKYFSAFWVEGIPVIWLLLIIIFR